MCMLCVANCLAELIDSIDTVSLDQLQFMLAKNHEVCARDKDVKELETVTTAILKALVDHRVKRELQSRAN